MKTTAVSINQKVRIFFNTYKINGCKVLLSVSGGADSVCMLHIIKSLAQEYGLTLYIAHFNHQLRKTAMRDQQFVVNLTYKLGLSNLFSTKIDVKGYARKKKLSIETAAREIRYEQLVKYAFRNGIPYVFTAHTMDDNAETVIFNLIRGTGLQGIAGIPQKRILSDKVEGQKKVLLLRPMLKLRRKEILEYLEAGRYQWREDETNTDEKYQRNFIRRNILPLMEKVNPGTKEHIAQLTEIVSEEQEFWQNKVSSAFHKTVKVYTGKCAIDIYWFRKYNSIIKHRLIGQLLQSLNLIGFSNIKKLVEFIEYGRVGGYIDIGGGWVCYRSYGSCLIKQRQRKKDVAAITEIRLKYPCVTVDKQRGITIFSQVRNARTDELNSVKRQAGYKAVMDYDKLRGVTLVVRGRQPGDWFYPLGMHGRKSVKKFFTDIKIPVWEKGKLVLLTGKGSHRVYWVAGYRIDDKVKISGKTKKVLELRIKKSI